MRLREENRSWGSLTPEQCRQEAEQTVEHIAPQLQGEILLSTKRYGYIFRKLKRYRQPSICYSWRTVQTRKL